MNRLPPLRLVRRNVDHTAHLALTGHPAHHSSRSPQAGRADTSTTTILPIVMSMPDYEKLGSAFGTAVGGLKVLAPHSASGLEDLSRLFRSVERVDIVLLDCHTVRAAQMCRTITRIRVAGWTGPIFVIAGTDSLPKIPIAMSLGAAEFALATTPVAEIEVRLSRLIKSITARNESVTTIPLPDGSLVSIHWRQHLVICNDIRVGLTLRELQLFGTLVENVGRTFSTAEIAQQAWGRAAEPESMTAAYVSSLRKKLAWFGNRLGIRTIRGLGYRFEIPTGAGSVANLGLSDEE